MVIGKPAPVVRACVDAVAAAMRTHQPHHALPVTQRTWLALCTRQRRHLCDGGPVVEVSTQQDALGPAYPRVPCPVTPHGTIAVTSARRAAG